MKNFILIPFVDIIRKSFVILLLLIGFVGHSQTITLVSKNVMADNVIAYTYSSSDVEVLSVKDSENLSATTEDMSTIFYSFENVMRSSFDPATGLITVIGNAQSTLPPVINADQIKSQMSDSGEKRYYYQKTNK